MVSNSMEIKINKKTYNIRNYNEQDHDAVMNIHFKELDNAGVLVRENVSDIDLDDINKYYLLNNGAFIIIEDEGKIIAIGGLLKINSRCVEITRMRVKYEYQRSGIGNRLLKHLEQIAKEKGYNELYLDTSSKQIAAQRLCEKNGYKKYKTVKEKMLDVYFYKKFIG